MHRYVIYNIHDQEDIMGFDSLAMAKRYLIEFVLKDEDFPSYAGDPVDYVIVDNGPRLAHYTLGQSGRWTERVIRDE